MSRSMLNAVVVVLLAAPDAPRCSPSTRGLFLVYGLVLQRTTCAKPSARGSAMVRTPMWVATRWFFSGCVQLGIQHLRVKHGGQCCQSVRLVAHKLTQKRASHLQNLQGDRQKPQQIQKKAAIRDQKQQHPDMRRKPAARRLNSPILPRRMPQWRIFSTGEKGSD